MNADTTGGGRAVLGGVLGGTAGDGWGRAAAYDAYADGLHTYALWYLRDHDAAADAVYCAFAAADRNHTTLRQPEQIQPWLYALLRRECRLRASEPDSPRPVSGRLRPKADGLGDSGVGASLLQLEGNLRRAEFHSLAWPDAEGLAPAHREVLELTIRHGLDSRGLALVLGLREGAAGLASTRGFGLLADAWRELERSLAAAAVAGSGRDNCAQLAELTFGFSGKLNATLRAPLTEHVDRCSRCQHYLHTVIGTPSAPTILPFVAAPRALRELLLGELADVDAAEAAGVDLVELGRRCGGFGPEGFPARVDLAHNPGTAAAGTGAGSVRPPRRRQTSARPHRAPRAGSVAGVPMDQDAPRPSEQRPASATQRPPQAPQTGQSVPPRTPPLSGQGPGPQSPSQGSTEVRPRPTSQGPGIPAARPGLGAQPSPAASAAAAGPRPPQQPQPRPAPRPTSSLTPAPELGLWVPPRPVEVEDVFSASGSWAERVLPPRSGAVQRAADPAPPRPQAEPTTEFVETASGRFATRTPLATSVLGRYPDAAPPAGTTPMPSDTTTSSPTPPEPTQASNSADSEPSSARRSPSGANRLPRYSRNGGGSAGVRARHKARPMRQAVVSAVALGAIGAAAAAAAALLGAGGGDPHTSTAALDNNARSNDVIPGASASAAGSPGASHGGGLSVSVATSGSAAQSATLGLPASASAGGASPSGAASSTAAAAGGFYVSVNQRDGDPYSVQILLRNAGTAPIAWSAAPSVSWLTLSQRTGTLEPGQSLSVSATATSAAPSGQWTARIVFQPGAIVVTVHGGVAAGSPGTPTGSTGAASSSPTSAAPSTSAGPTVSASPSSAAPSTSASAPASSTAAAPASGAASGADSASSPTSASASAAASAPADAPSGPAAAHPVRR